MLTIYIIIILLDYVSTKYSVVKSENEIIKLQLQLEKLEQLKLQLEKLEQLEKQRKCIQPYNKWV